MSIQKTNQIGQGMTEYIIIVALIAVSAIGVYSFFGKTMRHQMAAISSEVAGNAKESKNNISQAGKAAKKSGDNADKKVTLGNYNEAATEGATQ